MPEPVTPSNSSSYPSEEQEAAQFEVRKAERARARQLRNKWAAIGLVVAVTVGGAGLYSWRLVPSKPAAAASGMLALKGSPKVDLVVVGGTPAGVAAAVSAARNGLSVVLVEERPRVGGDIRYAMLNMFDVPTGSRTQHSPMAYGLFGALYRRLGVAFDVEKASRFLEQDLEKAKVTVHCDTRIARLYQDHSRVVGLAYKTANGPEEKLAAKVFVDATNDASFAALAGAGYRLGREASNPDRRMQSAGLLFSVHGVNWDQVKQYVRSQRVVSANVLAKYKRGLDKAIDIRLTAAKGNSPRTAIVRLGGGVGNYLWERGDIVKAYVPHGPNIEILSINFGRQTDGTVVLNTLNIVGVNGLSAASVKQAHDEAVRELPYFLHYLRFRMPGFKNAQLHLAAPELYIRETRHINGLYTLTADDVRFGMKFPDRIALCSYPLDLHPYKKGDKNPFGPQRYYYTLPLRSLVPKRIDGVFVASRSLSASYSAAGSARVIPVTMAAGEAAGTAATVCVREKLTPHSLAEDADKVKMVQDLLRKAGADVGDKLPEPKVDSPEPTPTPTLPPA